MEVRSSSTSSADASDGIKATSCDSLFQNGRFAIPLSDESQLRLDEDDLEAAVEAAKQMSEFHKKIVMEMNMGAAKLPAINICIMVVGTHGDVAPFCSLGKRLKDDGHRVRIATHANYRGLVVADSGLEFYPLSGDPAVLSEFMVKTGGKLIPDSWEAIESLPSKLQMMRDIIFSSYPAATRADPDAGGEGVPGEPFIADAIISNPPVYGHHHVAEALKIPLHLMFPQPWVPTCAFPHPLACIDVKRKRFSYKREWSTKNKNSYYLVQRLEWAAMGNLLNTFRFSLGLKPVPALDMDRLYASTYSRVPFVHMWSPAFVPKPPDWGPLVDVCGNFFSTKLEDAKWDPPADLAAWLESGPKPILVTFGSMKFDNAEVLTRKIYKAAIKSNCRILLQNGWSELGIKGVDPQAMGCFIIGRAPHDWLMQRCSAVIHHGGAGTTAAGLRCGLPTFICPFFGDQHFWGEMVFRAQLGPAPHPISELTSSGASSTLAKAFQALKDPAVVARAQQVAEAFAKEDGAVGGMQAFKRNLPVEAMACPLCLSLVLEGILQRPRKAELEVCVKPNPPIAICETCHAVVKTAFPEKGNQAEYQEWGLDGPVPSGMKKLLMSDLFSAASEAADENLSEHGTRDMDLLDRSYAWWEKKREELTKQVMAKADEVFSRNVLLPGDEKGLVKDGYGPVLQSIKLARAEVEIAKRALDEKIRNPTITVSNEERDAIIKFAIEVYDINSTIIENKNDPEVQQSLANNSTIAKEPAHLFGEFQCSEKSFSYLVNGTLYVYGSHLSFVAHKGELTSDNTAVINIPWGEVTDAWKNSKKRSPWDGLGVQVRTKRYRLSQWGIPLGAYNFSGLKTQQEAKEMHKAIEAAIVNFQTKHLAKVRIDNGGRQQEAL